MVEQVIVILTAYQCDGLAKVTFTLRDVSDVTYLKIQREGSTILYF
jgi:hypothetical protein